MCSLLGSNDTNYLIKNIHIKFVIEGDNRRGSRAKPERIYNPITAMGFSAMFSFQLDNTKIKHCRHPIAVIGVVDTFGQQWNSYIGFMKTNFLYTTGKVGLDLSQSFRKYINLKFE